MGRIGGVGAAMMLMGLGVTQPTSAQQSVMSAAGFTGLSVTPTAHLLPWGNLSISYDNEVVGGPSTGRSFTQYGTSGHNFVGGFGLLPFLEISGRLATNTIQSNCYSEGCGLRDLSFNFKGGINLDADGQWALAAGATDFGGNVTVFRSMYGVLTYSPEKYDISLGYARRGTNLVGSTKPLDGPFGSIAYKPFSFLETHVEYNDSKAWAGARVFAPSAWLPSGWAAYLSANFRVHGSEATSRSWFGLGVTVPLYKVPTVRTVSTAQSNSPALSNDEARKAVPAPLINEFSTRGIPESDFPGLSSNISSPGLSDEGRISKNVIAPTTDSQLEELTDELRAKGFEDIYVGRTPTGAIAIRVNNATYNVNTVDGLGVALGVVARRLGANDSSYKLILSQRQIEIVAVTGNAGCLADWIALKSLRCYAGQLHTPATSDLSALYDGAAWVRSGVAPSWSTVRLALQPVLATGLATEYGVLDYSVGIRATLQQPLWTGAYAEISHVYPVDDSKDFRDGGVFQGSRLINKTDKTLIHQVFRVPVELLFGKANEKTATTWGANALTAHLAAGTISSLYRGTYGELRWEPFDGKHRFGIEGGRFERATSYDYFYPKNSRPVLGSYRYSFSPTKTDFEVTAGQYLYNDRGAQFVMTQWFDDVAVSLYLRRTKYTFEKDSRTFAGIEMVIPLTPRKDMNPAYHVQVTGAPRWGYAIETKVGGSNFVSSNQGAFPGVAVLDRTFNSDRAGVSYFEENMARIRSAASR